MSYSDEPHVISEKKKSPLLIGGIVLLGLFFLLLAAVALYPRYLEFQRHNATWGPHGGIVYFIRFEGNRYSMEIPRTEAQDYHVTFIIQPVRETTQWLPEDHTIRFQTVQVTEHEEDLEWNAEINAFGPSVIRLHPGQDFELDIELFRRGERVWTGRRWAFGERAHAH